MDTWVTGRLLYTRDTSRWTDDERYHADLEERKMIFTNFTSFDEGRSRVFIKRYETTHEASLETVRHNRLIEFLYKMKRVYRKINKDK